MGLKPGSKAGSRRGGRHSAAGAHGLEDSPRSARGRRSGLPDAGAARGRPTGLPGAGEAPGRGRRPRRSRRAGLGEVEAPGAGEVEKVLALLALAGGAQEQPAEEPEGEDGLLDHHDRPGEVLVGQRGDVEGDVSLQVEGVEDGPRPQEDVAEDGGGQADRDDVDQPAEVAEPARRGQGAEQAHPHVDPEAEEHGVLEEVDPVVAQGRLVEERQVPHVQVHGPQRERRWRDGTGPAAGRTPARCRSEPSGSGLSAARSAPARSAGRLCRRSAGARSCARRGVPGCRSRGR